MPRHGKCLKTMQVVDIQEVARMTECYSFDIYECNGRRRTISFSSERKESYCRAPDPEISKI